MRPPGEASEELQLCDDLAAAHRLLAACGLEEPGRGRLSAKLACGGGHLTSPEGRLWAAVTPWNLVRCPGGAELDPLHTSAYEVLPAGSCAAVVQCHSPALEAVSCLEEGLLFLSAASAGLYGRVAYREWPALAAEGCGHPAAEVGDGHLPAEAASTAGALRAVPRPPALALITRGHGALTLGTSVAEAFVAMYDLHRSCVLQLRVFGTGLRVRRPSERALERLARAHELDPALRADRRWGAMRAWLGASEHGDLPTPLRPNPS